VHNHGVTLNFAYFGLWMGRALRPFQMQFNPYWKTGCDVWVTSQRTCQPSRY